LPFIDFKLNRLTSIFLTQPLVAFFCWILKLLTSKLIVGLFFYRYASIYFPQSRFELDSIIWFGVMISPFACLNCLFYLLLLIQLYINLSFTWAAAFCVCKSFKSFFLKKRKTQKLIGYFQLPDFRSTFYPKEKPKKCSILNESLSSVELRLIFDHRRLCQCVQLNRKFFVGGVETA